MAWDNCFAQLAAKGGSMTATANTFSVPGASLYYETRGSGPVLLLIAGGNGDAVPFQRAADALAGRYTIVAYDRRGFSRSRLDGPVPERRIETDSDDAHRLLNHLSAEPSYVFGSSSGAIVALDLVCRHPQQFRTVIAHEPPIATLLPDCAQWLEFFDEVYDTYRSSGVGTAMEKFSARMGPGGIGGRPPADEVPPRRVEMMDRVRRNQDLWLNHEIRQYPRFVPDAGALKAALPRLVLAGGRDSRQYFPYRPNTVMADQLGTTVVDFPGGHVGYATHPAEFAVRLTEVLTG
jgi:acetyltransferase/esterase